MTDLIRTCALCKHCDISLGTKTYSAYTPGEPAEVYCSKKHNPLANGDRCDLLPALRRTAQGCPDFHLMDEPQ